MVGRPVDLTVDKSAQNKGEIVLSVRNLNVYDPSGRVLVKNLSIDVAAGEILGIAGVQGNGQSEFAQSVIGLSQHVTGSIKLSGEELVGETVAQCLHAGIAYVPESREFDGLISSFTIAENLVLDVHDLSPYSRGILYKPDVVNRIAAERVSEFDIRAQGVSDPASSLSGGNKQKVVLARELSRPVSLVIASQPTRGLDVGSIEFVHERLVQERDSGRAVVVVSTELDEIFALSDRIAVMYQGEIVAIVPATTSRDVIGLYMAGSKPEATA